MRKNGISPLFSHYILMERIACDIISEKKGVKFLNFSAEGAAMEIKRDMYLNKLIDRENNGLIKIVTGIRRCGKSYLLFNLFHQYLLDKGVREDQMVPECLA